MSSSLTVYRIRGICRRIIARISQHLSGRSTRHRPNDEIAYNFPLCDDAEVGVSVRVQQTLRAPQRAVELHSVDVGDLCSSNHNSNHQGKAKSVNSTSARATHQASLDLRRLPNTHHIACAQIAALRRRGDLDDSISASTAATHKSACRQSLPHAQATTHRFISETGHGFAASKCTLSSMTEQPSSRGERSHNGEGMGLSPGRCRTVGESKVPYDFPSSMSRLASSPAGLALVPTPPCLARSLPDLRPQKPLTHCESRRNAQTSNA